MLWFENTRFSHQLAWSNSCCSSYGFRVAFYTFKMPHFVLNKSENCGLNSSVMKLVNNKYFNNQSNILNMCVSVFVWRHKTISQRNQQTNKTTFLSNNLFYKWTTSFLKQMNAFICSNHHNFFPQPKYFNVLYFAVYFMSILKNIHLLYNVLFIVLFLYMYVSTICVFYFVFSYLWHIWLVFSLLLKQKTFIVKASLISSLHLRHQNFIKRLMCLIVV